MFHATKNVYLMVTTMYACNKILFQKIVFIDILDRTSRIAPVPFVAKTYIILIVNKSKQESREGHVPSFVGKQLVTSGYLSQTIEC